MSLFSLIILVTLTSELELRELLALLLLGGGGIGDCSELDEESLCLERRRFEPAAGVAV